MPIRLRQRQRSEGCFDRSEASHTINLCDMNAKYADVLPTSDVLAFFDTLPMGLFKLPNGSDAGAEPDAADGHALRVRVTQLTRS